MIHFIKNSFVQEIKIVQKHSSNTNIVLRKRIDVKDYDQYH